MVVTDWATDVLLRCTALTRHQSFLSGESTERSHPMPSLGRLLHLISIAGEPELTPVRVRREDEHVKNKSCCRGGAGQGRWCGAVTDHGQCSGAVYMSNPPVKQPGRGSVPLACFTLG